MTAKNNQAQHIIQSLKGQAKSTRYSFNLGNGGSNIQPLVNTFQMATRNSSLSVRNAQEEMKSTNNLTEKFEKDIIEILKNENKMLALKI